ncbi:MAG TPA: hypothetical protein VK714_07170 [Myxococcota bacterium]|nr:hypothetical protein [Myxococcota bacterium]
MGAVQSRREVVREAVMFTRQEVPVPIEEELGTRPAALYPHPLDRRPAGEVKGCERVPQAMRREAAMRPKRFPDDSTKDSISEVVGVEERPIAAREDEGFVSKHLGGVRLQSVDQT